MRPQEAKRTPRTWWLPLCLLTLVSMALASQEPTTFVNQTGQAIFLKVHLTDDAALCAEGEYVTYEIAPGEQETVEFGESTSACYCALSVPRATCEFPETTQPGETVVIETVEGEQE